MDILEKIKTKKIIGLAPMAGYTNSAFRQICKKFGANLVYSEMISADGLVYNAKKTTRTKKSFELAAFDSLEKPIFIQIFGKDPAKMAEAAKLIIDNFNPDGIDINMGCPARKVVSSFHGASLMKNPDLASKIVSAVKQTIGNKILSVKTRTGWEDENDIFQFAKTLEQAGADLIALHCRTKKQGFAGEANWAIIKELKQTIKIPILANGGIKDLTTAKNCLMTSGADGILIGQTALGRPWIFEEIKTNRKIEMSIAKIKSISEKFVELYAKSNANSSIIELRKHLIQFWKGIANCSDLRKEILQINNLDDYKKAVSKFANQRDHVHADEDKL